MRELINSAFSSVIIPLSFGVIDDNFLSINSSSKSSRISLRVFDDMYLFFQMLFNFGENS